MKHLLAAAAVVVLAASVSAQPLPPGMYVLENNLDYIAKLNTANSLTTEFPVTDDLNSFFQEIEHHRGFFYVSEGDTTNPSAIYVIDDNTFELVRTVALDIEMNRNIAAMEFVGETLYASVVTAQMGGASADLAAIDLETGAVAIIGSTNIGRPVSGLAFDGRVMYGCTGGGSNAELLAIDLDTGNASSIGVITASSGTVTFSLTGLEFGIRGVLYGLTRPFGGESLIRINPSDATVSQNNPLPQPDGTVAYNGITAKSHGLLLSDDNGIGGLGGTGMDLTAPRIEPSFTPANPVMLLDVAVGQTMVVAPARPDGGQTELVRFERFTGVPMPQLLLNMPMEGDTLTACEFVGDTLFAAVGTEGNQTAPSYLAQVDLGSGDVTVIGPTGVDGPVGGLAYDGSTMLGAYSGEDGGAILAAVNLSTGAFASGTPVTNPGSGTPVPLTGLTFSPDGTLFGLGQNNNVDFSTFFAGQLLIIDRSSGLLDGSSTITFSPGTSGISGPPQIVAPDENGCVADLTTTGATIPGFPGFGEPDGVADLDDLGFFLNDWLVSNPAADFTTTGATIPNTPGFGIPDGVVNLDDLGYFLNFWLVGCS